MSCFLGSSYDSSLSSDKLVFCAKMYISTVIYRPVTKSDFLTSIYITIWEIYGKSKHLKFSLQFKMQDMVNDEGRERAETKSE